MDKKAGAAAPADTSDGAIAAGVFAFEGDWETDLRQNWSIGSVLDAMQDFGDIKCIHRDIGTVEELQHYIDRWLQDRYGGYQVGYFGFHGSPGKLWLDEEHHVSLEDLAAMIGGRAAGRVIHFGSCSVMRISDRRLRRFHTSTGARAVVGYRRDVDSDLNWVAFEMLLLEALSRFRQTGAPARHLHNNHGYLADKLGFAYIC